MAGSVSDKITDTRNTARPNSARVSSPRSSGGTPLVCDNLTGWPTASKVHFVTYQIDSNSDAIPGTQLDCYGIVSGNNIGTFTVIDGSDNGNSIGDIVEMLPTAGWGQDLADALTVGHTRTGSHIPSLPLTSPILTTPVISDFTSATHTHANAAGGGQIANSGISGVNTDKLSNLYKFNVYRHAAQNTSAGTPIVLQCDTRAFDTSSNVDIVTNKGRFTAPIAGFYWFSAAYQATYNGAGAGYMALYKNGAASLIGMSVSTTAFSNATNNQFIVSGLIQLAANDYVEAYVFSSATIAITVDLPNNYFQGFLVSAT